MAHAYLESTNPREAGRCACGRGPGDHPQPNTEVRDLERERELTYEAARGAVDPTALIEFAETRAGGDHGYGAPHMLRAGIDWKREARPEAADLRNYLVWWLLKNPGDPKAHDMFLALRHVTLLYDLLIREGD